MHKSHRYKVHALSLIMFLTKSFVFPFPKSQPCSTSFYLILFFENVITNDHHLKYYIYYLFVYLFIYYYYLPCYRRCMPQQEEVSATVEIWRLGRLDPAAPNTTLAHQLLWKRYSLFSLIDAKIFFHGLYC